MINIFGQVSKLIVIFIFTVIVSGSILTYLSITNISNYRESLENKISDEEHALMNRFTSDFQNKIDSLTVKLASPVENETFTDLQNLNYFQEINVLTNYVKIDSAGSYIIPYFVNNEPSLIESIPSKVYADRLHSAENNEFISKDFKTSETFYLKALNVAASKSDSAHLYNSIARLYIKMDLDQKAYDASQTILTKFSSTINSSGFPYAYFSVIKLLKLSNTSDIEKLQKLLLSFLNGMAIGTIPLNDSSEELLDLILAWQEEFEDSLNNELFKELIEQNKNSLRLINNYKIPIEQIFNEKKEEYTKVQSGDYSSIKPTFENTAELMLFFKHPIYSEGFVIGLDQLFMDILKNLQKDHLKFEYDIQLVQNTGANRLLRTNLIMLSEFSSHFEDSLIQVSLNNKDIIDESVFRRKITYGIVLFLILGTMILGLYLLIQDVNREKKMKILRKDFISNVTHELKTPLTSINMFAEALNMGNVKSKSDQKKYINIIVKESEKLKRLINNILEFSKKENDKLSYKLEKSNLTDIVNSSIKGMDYFIEINKIDLNLKIENNVIAKVDAEGIKQALSNLISNAIKYSSSNKKLNIALFKKELEIFIEIEDFGIGISPEERKLVFDKFYRVNSEENKTTSGTGLGLTVTKDIIEGQYGKLLVESTLGKGSKFTIVLNTV